MKRFKRKRGFYFLLLLLLFLIFIAFKDLGSTFFQQDEWLGLGQIKAYGWESVTSGFNIFQLIFGDGRPLTRVLGVLLFENFGFNFQYFALYSIFFHFINSILVFLMARKLLKNDIVSFLSAGFFAINSVSHQGVSWFGASFGGLPSTFLIFLSIYLMLVFIQSSSTKHLYFSYLSAIASLYFKESGIFLFILLPLLPVMLSKKINLQRYLRNLFPFAVFIATFISYRVYQIFYSHLNARNAIEGASVFLTSQNNDVLLTIFLRFILYPLTSLSLIYTPSNIASVIAFAMHRGYYSYIVDRADLVVYTVILDLFAVFISFIGIILVYMVWKQEKKLRPSIYFFVAFFTLSFLPYFLIGKSYAYLEPRYYYVASAPAGILIGIFAIFLLRYSKARMRNIVNFLFFAFISVLFLVHIKTIHTDIRYQVNLAVERKNFLLQLEDHKKTLNNEKNVFYFTGDKPWLVDGNRTPFQHGFGYSLLVIYYDSGKIPRELLSTEYLFALGEQGYFENKKNGIGYFYDMSALREAYEKNKFSIDDIFGYYYNSTSRKLDDITEEVRGAILEKH